MDLLASLYSSRIDGGAKFTYHELNPWYEGRVAIHIIAEELDSTGQPYPRDHHDCLFTEDNDADTDADTYDDSDADAAAYGGDEL